MASIDSYDELRQILLDCGSPFHHDRDLAAVFVDSRLYPWRNSVPQAGSAEARVQATLYALHNQHNLEGQNALVLLVEVLRDLKDPLDGCHQRLGELAVALAKNLAEVQATLSEQAPQLVMGITQKIAKLEGLGDVFSERELEAKLAPLRQQLAMLQAQTAAATRPDFNQNSTEIYLKRVFNEANKMASLTYIDPSLTDKHLELSQVYTALLTEESETQAGAPGGNEPRAAKRSVLEQLNRYDRLVLIGRAGSGKSTLVDFVTLCMAGELLEGDGRYLALLRTPLPKEPGEDKEPAAPDWTHGALLPVKIVLRKFASKGLPEPGQKANAAHLWAYLAQELAEAGLVGYFPHFQEQLEKRGGLLLFDGLDEVAQPKERCPQLREVIEEVALLYKRCRVVVTSRPYAYKQEWQLNPSFKATRLALFSDGQISQFIARWYGYLNQEKLIAHLTHKILSRSPFLVLARQPLLLTLMANLNISRGQLPEKRAQLYEETTNLLLERWEQSHFSDATAAEAIVSTGLSQLLQVEQGRIRHLLDDLALEAQTNQPMKVEGTANLDGTTLLHGFNKLTEDHPVNIGEVLNFIDQRAGILEGVGNSVYRFPHRTFQEYLAACALNRQYGSSKKIAGLVKAEPNRWREVALLAAATRNVESFWTLVSELCPIPVQDMGQVSTAEFMAALIAGQAIYESIRLNELSEGERYQVSRVGGWLEAIGDSDLPPLERVTAGQLLAKLGDGRRGVA